MSDMAERLITINIRRYLSRQPRTKRVKRAARYIRERASHYMKIDEENVKISKELNNRIVKFYSRRMVPVKLKAKIEDGKAVLNEFSAAKAEDTKPSAAGAAKKKTAEKAADTKGAPNRAKKTEGAAKDVKA